MNEVEQRNGAVYGFAAYLIWGGFPLFFQLVRRSGAFEIIAYRIVFSLAFCLLLVALTRGWRRIREILSNPRGLGLLALGGLLVMINWTVYVWGVNNGHTIDAALGYFINPLMSAVLGVSVLGERLRRAQVVAFGIGALAVVVLVVGYGKVPWVALGVSTSFALYSLVKNRVGRRVDALSGLVIETASVFPLAIAYLWWLGAAGGSTMGFAGGYGWLLVLSGPLTALPLLLFAAAASRVSLTMIGILQYICPMMQFCIGWLVFGERMPIKRWIGFALIWVAIAVFAADSARRSTIGSVRRPRIAGRRSQVSQARP
ncbi:chloramphenicol-sensitive protein RarD [Propionibacterium cyclohexanicum]|uniref:Chloramphenicol-sensitive protein RarD n=1 Tax=Propionibacterium cyclohexanicum TaxID=64702 RepID=A0A1H9RJZ1_9ACTN|nr:EamA family transporter RarD [Propionibacterium cyclohexanicum]SER72363.1 chloramphenicol-sensitive protein RarD [Propionibacterium cyclohexanicum]